MTAIPDLSTIITALTTSGYNEQLVARKDSRMGTAAATATVAGQYSSLWQFNGYPGGTGVAPTTVAIPTNATAGAMKQTDPSGGRQKWLMGMTAVADAQGTLTVYDRLAHNGNLSGTTTSAQTFSMTPTRNTSGVGTQIFAEIYTIIGTTARTITASYTNQAGTSGQTTRAVAIGATGWRETTRMIYLPLASGDTGVQSVQSITLSGSTGTAGAFGITLVKPLIVLPLAVLALCSSRDTLTEPTALPEIETGACLASFWLPNSTTAPRIDMHLTMVEN